MKATSQTTRSNLVIVKGVVSSAVLLRELASGSTVAQFDVKAENGAVPVAVHEPKGAVLSLSDGDEIVVTGEIKRRFFRVGGRTESRTEIIADRVVPATHHKRLRTVLAELADDVAAMV